MSTADIVNNWFRERIACSAVARDTEAYNQVAAALPDLIGRIDPDAAAPQTEDPALPQSPPQPVATVPSTLPPAGGVADI